MDNTTHHHSEETSFVPLIVTFAVVAVLTVVLQFFSTEVSSRGIMLYFMASFFLVFGGLKAINWKLFVEAFSSYDVLAQKSSLYAWSYPAIELLLGFAYLIRFALVATNVVTIVVMLITAYSILKVLIKKQTIVCACLGAIFKLPLSKVSLFESILMATMAALSLVKF
jgi:hypothetical protein